MTITSAELSARHCKACEGGVAPLSADQVRSFRQAVPHWELTGDGQRLRREWHVKDFASGLEFFQAIAQVAEAEDHHPDLHLTGYRDVVVELWTHALGGLSENDFILAARIDKIPVALKP